MRPGRPPAASAGEEARVGEGTTAPASYNRLPWILQVLSVWNASRLELGGGGSAWVGLGWVVMTAMVGCVALGRVG